MAPFTTALLGVLIGSLVGQARVDSVYWRLFGNSAESLKSHLTLPLRQDGLYFYRVVGNTNLDYTVLATVALVVLSLVGGSIVTKHVQKKLYNLGALLLVVAATMLDILRSRPLIAVIQKGGIRVNTTTTANLFLLSKYHAATLAMLLVALSFQMSSDDVEEDGEDEIDEHIVTEKKQK